jgi:hypothetical protein
MIFLVLDVHLFRVLKNPYICIEKLNFEKNPVSLLKPMISNKTSELVKVYEMDIFSD